MVNLGDGGDGAFAAAARDALLDADGGRQAVDGVDIGPGHLLDKLPGVGIEGVEKTALAFRKKNVERERAFAGTADAGDDDKLVAWDADGKVAEVVFARALDGDPAGVGRLVAPRGHGSHALGGL